MSNDTEAALAAMREELAAAIEELGQARQEIDQLRLEMLDREEAIWKALNSLSEAQAATVQALTAQVSGMFEIPAPQEAEDAAKPDTGGMYQ
jgi:phage host-nuclease inhibitor protein Gam